MNISCEITKSEHQDSISLFANNSRKDPYLFSKEIDRKLDFRLFKIESKLLKKYRAFYKSEDDSNRKKHFPSCQAWIGLHHYTLQTPYCFIYEAFQYLKSINCDLRFVIDIGAGYGRVGLVVSQAYEDVRFIGYEVVKERVREGNRVFEKFGLSNFILINENVLKQEFSLPLADVYFIYDFGEKDDIYLLLEIISRYTAAKEIFLIANGDYVNELLSGMSLTWKLEHDLNHNGKMKIYRSKND